MLVLNRRPGEVIKIGDDIEILVRSVSSKVASICITAPRELAVDRAEVRARKDAEKRILANQQFGGNH